MELMAVAAADGAMDLLLLEIVMVAAAVFYSDNYYCSYSKSVHMERKWVSGLAMNLYDEMKKKKILVLEDMIAKDLFGNWMKIVMKM